MLKKYGSLQAIGKFASNYNDAVGLLPSGLAEKGDEVMRRTASKLNLNLNSDKYRFYRTRSISSGGDFNVEYLNSRQANVSERLRLHGENGNGDYFESDQLKEYYRTFVEPYDINNKMAQKPALCCVNHKYAGDGSTAVGFIVVAYYNQDEFPNGQYVENIRAVDKELASKRYAGLIEAIDEGIFTDTSMGVMCEESICSVCGSVARTELDLCSHARNKYALRARGENVYEINRGLDFFEDSFIGDESLLSGGRHSYVLDIYGTGNEGADPNAKVLQIVASRQPRDMDKEILLATAERSPLGVFSPLKVGGEFLSVRMTDGTDELRGRSRSLDKKAYAGGAPDGMSIGDGEYVDVGDQSEKYEEQLDVIEDQEENTSYVVFDDDPPSIGQGEPVVFEEVNMAETISASIRRKADFEGEYPIVAQEGLFRAKNDGAGWVVEKSDDGVNFVPVNAVAKDRSDYEGAMSEYNQANPGHQFADANEFYNSQAYGTMVLQEYQKDSGGTMDFGTPAQEMMDATQEPETSEPAPVAAPEVAEEPLPAPPKSSSKKKSLTGFAIDNYVKEAKRALLDTSESFVPNGYRRYALRLLAQELLEYETDENLARRMIGKAAQKVNIEGAFKIEAYTDDDEANKVKVISEDENGEVLATEKISLPIAIASSEIPELLSQYISTPALS